MLVMPLLVPPYFLCSIMPPRERLYIGETVFLPLLLWARSLEIWAWHTLPTSMWPLPMWRVGACHILITITPNKKAWLKMTYCQTVMHMQLYQHQQK